MQSHQDFKQLKLATVKAFLASNTSELDGDISNKITKANSVIEIWCILFSEKLIELYNKIIAAGVSPSSQEMNEIQQSTNLTAWHWLAASDDCTPLFHRLLDQGIMPDAKALSECDKGDNSNGWYWLAASDARVPLFQHLLDQGIMPDAKALSECRIDGNINAWHWLAASDARIPLFQRLLDQRIMPDAKALSACRKADNTNAWHWLAGSDDCIPLFHRLLDQGIMPEAKALSACRIDDNTTAWYWLAASDAGIPLFQRLLDQGIMPEAMALSECDKSDNTNAWYWLAASDARIPLFQRLLEHDIVPNSANLNGPIEQAVLKRRHKSAEKILLRLKKLVELTRDYHFNQNKLTALLTREDREKFNGFLYLFYLMKNKKKPEIVLPIELWSLIGKYILPFSMRDYSNFKVLSSEENQTIFAKAHTIGAIDGYLRIRYGLFNSHNERMLSMKQDLKETIDPIQVRKKISGQYYMSRNPMLTYAKEPTKKKHEKPYSTVLKDAKAALLLEDACALAIRFKT